MTGNGVYDIITATVFSRRWFFLRVSTYEDAVALREKGTVTVSFVSRE